MDRIKKIVYFNPGKELCETCSKSQGRGCPIWPPMRFTNKCVEYVETIERKKGNN